MPVGAAVFDVDGNIIAEVGNASIANCDTCAQAEILALRAASQETGNYRLPTLSMAHNPGTVSDVRSCDVACAFALCGFCRAG